MEPQSLTVGKTQIRILPTVKGLVSESQIVEDEINSFKPELVALSIGPEEISGTRDWDGEPYDMSGWDEVCLLYTSPSPRDRQKSRMPSSA